MENDPFKSVCNNCNHQDVWHVSKRCGYYADGKICRCGDENLDEFIDVDIDFHEHKDFYL